MKLVQCIVRQEKLDSVVEKVSTITPGLTVSDVGGHGRQGSLALVYRGAEYEVFLLPKAMIEMVTDDNKVEDVIKAVTGAAWTGQIGDGRIFVVNVEESYHIRTGMMD
jgi:nitrogen regulatory protein P-II 2